MTGTGSHVQCPWAALNLDQLKPGLIEGESTLHCSSQSGLICEMRTRVGASGRTDADDCVLSVQSVCALLQQPAGLQKQYSPSAVAQVSWDWEKTGGIYSFPDCVLWFNLGPGLLI